MPMRKVENEWQDSLTDVTPELRAQEIEGIVEELLHGGSVPFRNTFYILADFMDVFPGLNVADTCEAIWEEQNSTK